MKKSEIYICEYCGTRYDSENECEDCENSHVGIEKISCCNYLSKACHDCEYPVEVKILFEDGEEKIYYLANK